MIELDQSELLGPAGGHARLMHDAGMTAEQAFDTIAERATQPEFLSVIRQFEATPEGRKLLQDIRRSWDRAGLPCPFDNLLELRPVS